MKPILEKIVSSDAYSFSSEFIQEKQWKSKWHYHESQVEIILMLEGSGVGFVGDGSTFYSEGDIAIIGSKVPHVWLNDKNFDEEKLNKSNNAIVIKFNENFLGDRFLHLPGCSRIRKTIFERSKRGLSFYGETSIKLKQLIKNIDQTPNDFERVVLLLEVLYLMSNTREYNYISKCENLKIPRSSDLERIEKIIKYVNENYQDRIELEKVAALANMTPSSFCKYFKKKTLKTFTQFLNEVRIGNACKLILQDDLNIKQICYMSGFNYLSNFYKQFHAIHKLSPMEYKEKLMTSELNRGL